MSKAAPQLALRLDGRDRRAAAVDALYDACGRAVSAVTHKEAAFALDTQPSYLSNALARRERNYLRLDWLPYFADVATDDDIVAVLAELRGMDVVARPTMTPAEELAALRAALATTVGPEVQRIVEAKVRGGSR